MSESRRKELAYIGPANRHEWRRLPLLRVRWLDADCEGRSRPGLRVTEKGYRKGCKPGNHGRRFPPEPLTPDEVLRLLAAIPGNTKAGIRNRALIAFLWRTGLRIDCEALELRPHHVDFAAYRVTVLNGKGGKRRIVAADAFALAQLSPWVMERAMLNVPASAPLFCSVSQPNPGQRLWSAYVREAIHEYGRRAGIPKRVHPHGFRHTLTCDLIREGFPLSHAQSQLGHSSIATTAIYARGLGADAAFDAIAERPMPGAPS
jgi:integrase